MPVLHPIPYLVIDWEGEKHKKGESIQVEVPQDENHPPSDLKEQRQYSIWGNRRRKQKCTLLTIPVQAPSIHS